MLAVADSTTLLGLDAHPIRVEVEAQRGIPQFELVGLAEAAVRESRVRVKSAIAHLGIDLGEYRIVVNLAPADLRKFGSGFDLAIAAATLAALRAVPEEALSGTTFLGELSLSGAVHAHRGVLPQLLGARRRGVARAVVPRANEEEAALVDGLDVRTVATLGELYAALRGGGDLPRPKSRGPSPRALAPVEDLADVRGQHLAKRALEIAAAGEHNLLFLGPPGAGKTMLARRLPPLLPELEHGEVLEVTAIHSVAGLLGGARRSLERARPFRAPHHTVSDAALVGGGDGARPGEVSLAHLGVLFLDELPEFKRSALESLRQPLEDGCVTVSRAHVKVTYPARPLVVCAMNPCPCGFLGDPGGRCGCTPERVRAYRGRVSGPLVDRLDVHVALPAVPVTELQQGARGEPTVSVRARVLRAREAQRARLARGETSVATNGALPARDVERVCELCPAGSRLMAQAVDRLGLSARAYGKVLRVARTLADMDGRDGIAPAHVAEAVSLRVLDRQGIGVGHVAA
jgi:magnesium chelatase family protein